MSTPSIPDFKRPPRKFIEGSQRERARRKACHGDWTPCERHEGENVRGR